MQTQKTKMRTLIGILATIALLLPMADGCHKHSKALAAEKAEKIKPYPLKTCIVTDEKLGEHGKPYVFTNQNQEIKLCCKECLKDFKKEPAKYTEKIEKAEKKK